MKWTWLLLASLLTPATLQSMASDSFCHVLLFRGLGYLYSYLISALGAHKLKGTLPGPLYGPTLGHQDLAVGYRYLIDNR